MKELPGQLILIYSNSWNSRKFPESCNRAAVVLVFYKSIWDNISLTWILDGII